MSIFAPVRRRNRGDHRGTKWKGSPAILTIQSMPTESRHLTTDRGRRFLVRRSYEDYFPATEYAGYDAFLNADGEPVKSEPRTRVVILRRLVGGMGGISMRNKNGVILHLRGDSEEALLQLGRNGMTIKLRE